MTDQRIKLNKTTKKLYDSIKNLKKRIYSLTCDCAFYIKVSGETLRKMNDLIEHSRQTLDDTIGVLDAVNRVLEETVEIYKILFPMEELDGPAAEPAPPSANTEEEPPS